MPEYSAQALAGLVEGVLKGEGSTIVTGVADLHSATAHDVSFLGNPKYLPAARRTQAGVVLLAPDAPEDFSFTQIRVASPSLAFSKVVELFRPTTPHPAPGIHPTAVLGAGVKVADGVTVDPYVVIEAGVEIGAHAVIGAGSFIGRDSRIGEHGFLYPRVVLRERTVVGNRVIVHSGAVIGSDGFGYEFQKGRHVKIPQLGFVQLDDDVEIGANVAIDRGRFGRTWIKQGAKIDNLVQIAHNVVIGAHSVVVAQAGISGSTTLGDYVTLAGQAGVVGHIHIGDRATITAQSGVSKDVPPGVVVAGRHARPLRESLKLEALLGRLPELWERVKKLERP